MAVGKVLVWDEDGVLAWVVCESGWKGTYLLIKAKNWHSRSGEFTCAQLVHTAKNRGYSRGTVLKSGVRMLHNGQEHHGSRGHLYDDDSSLNLGIKAFEEEVVNPLNRLLMTPKNIALAQAAQAERMAELSQIKANRFAAQAEALYQRAAQL